MNTLIDAFLLKIIKNGDYPELARIRLGETRIFKIPAHSVSVTRGRDGLEICAVRAKSEDEPEFFKIPIELE